MSTDGGHRPPLEPRPSQPSPLGRGPHPAPPEPSPLGRGPHPAPPEPEPPGRAPQPGPLAGHPDPLILDQAFDKNSLYPLRAAVAAHAAQAGLASGRTDDLVIAVHELAANAVRHGAGHGRLRVWKSDRALLCEISDDGLPQPAGTGDATQWSTEPGHGLSLVRQVADQASLHSGPSGTLATISFALDVPGPPFRLDQRHLDGCTLLAVTGPLDLGSAAQLTAAIGALLAPAPADPPVSGLRLVLDLSGLSGWDSVGLAALVTAQQRINAAPPARMILAGLPAHLAKHLREASLADRFTLADTPATAVRTLTPPA
jgi:anti-sigma regulatory factor (Ser/Thr protein kinase)/anti-anti-sigma regulatory factor